MPKIVAVCSTQRSVSDFIATYLRDNGVYAMSYINPKVVEEEPHILAAVIHCYPPNVVEFPFFSFARRLSYELANSRKRLILLAPNKVLAGWEGLAEVFSENDVFGNLAKLARYLKRLKTIELER